MTKEEITKQCLERLKKCEELLQKNQSWGRYVSCAFAQEIVRQAVEDACFFMQKHKVKLIDEEKKARQELVDTLTKLNIKDSYILEDNRNPVNYSLSVFLYHIGKQHEMKFIIKDSFTGYKITRIK